MKKMLFVGCMAAMLGSFTSCLQEPDIKPAGENMITLSVGFESQVPAGSPQEVDSKTFLSGEKSVNWGSPSQDKVIYVFDSKGVKNAFNAVEPVSTGATRAFAGTISEDSEISHVIWTGVVATSDQCSLENGVFSGSTLKLKNPQNVNNAKSFDNVSNIAVMKPGDTALRNVFGYIKYTVPAVEGGTAGAIKSVTFSAKEPLAGQVQIDYTGDEPMATIVAEGASNTLTVNTRVKNNALEAGNVYAVLPVGTYTNFNIKVTLPDDTSFDLPVSDPVVIERGKYTTAGTLPVSDPNASEEPEQPEESTVWPTDSTAFDYGMSIGSSKVADMTGFEAAGIPHSTAIPASMGYQVTLDKITYCGNETKFWNTPRIVTNRAKAFEKVGGVNIPTATTQHFFFKINKPGTLSFFPRYSNNPTETVFVVALVTTTEYGVNGKYLFAGTPATKSSSEADKNKPECRISVDVTEEDLNGITEAATVYVFHKDVSETLSYYPITWTSKVISSSEAQFTGKFLLAGDSQVTEYTADAYPQTGWGQCLAAALGGDVQIRNHAIGGESTKSFIDSGKWANLMNETVRGDVVMIYFMGNDQKTDEAHATDPATTYRDNLRKFLSDVRAKGAVPVLVTSVLRRMFHSNGLPQRNMGEYPDAMRAVANETNTLLIDCEEWSYNWLSGLGFDGAEPYYVTNKRNPEAMDNSHFTDKGAEIVAEFIASELVRLGVWTKEN